jgi:hypothetical protein
MARHARHLILAIVLGVVTTIAVAWACALWIPITFPTTSAPVFTIRDFDSGGLPPSLSINVRVWNDARLGATRVALSVHRSPFNFVYADLSITHSLDDHLPFWHERDLDDVLPSMLIDDARGWPFLAMRGSFDIDSSDGRGNIENVRSAILIDFGTRLPGADRSMTPLLPLGIIWGGFILNALFFAAIWFALLAGPGFAKRAFRRRRGACIDCGYDLRGAAHEQCPECGRAA